MKRFSIIVFTLVFGFCVFLFFSNRNMTGIVVPQEKAGVSTILDKTTEAIIEASQSDNEKLAQNISNKIPPEQNETFLNIYSLNLDNDDPDEQIITAKKQDDKNESIYIIIVDYSESVQKWIRLWEGPTIATKIKTFTLQAKDIIGDHSLDLLCYGMNNKNEQTLTVFWRSPNFTDATVTYKTIFQYVADSLRVEDIQQSEGYQLAQTNGIPSPILAYSKDEASLNYLDQIETTFEWNFRTQLFEKTKTKSVPGSVIKDQKLQELLTGDGSAFSEYLDGLWFLESMGSPGTETAKIFMFDQYTNTIIFSTNDNQEVFSIENSHPTRVGLYISARNQSVKSLDRYINVELTGTDRITIFFTENLKIRVSQETAWNGTYKKITQGMQATIKTKEKTSMIKDIKLTGTFKTDEGLKITFNEPYFTQEEASGKQSTGGYAFFTVGDKNVLELKYLKENGLTLANYTYISTYSEYKEGRIRVQTLTLTPAMSTVKGIVPTDGQKLVFEQKN